MVSDTCVLAFAFLALASGREWCLYATSPKPLSPLGESGWPSVTLDSDSQQTTEDNGNARLDFLKKPGETKQRIKLWIHKWRLGEDGSEEGCK